MIKYNPNKTVITTDSNKMIQIGFLVDLDFLN